MRLYKATVQFWDEKGPDKSEESGWGDKQETYVAAPVASEVAVKYEERSDTMFHSVELITDSLVEIEI